VLFLIGLFFVDEWIFTSWKRLSLTDYLIVLAIVLTIISQGFLMGVALGLGLTIVFFLVRFAQIPAIREETSLEILRSTRERSIPEQILLTREGSASIVLKLSGYLFFGSAYFAGNRIKALLENEQPPEEIIIDLTDVQGFDISSVNTFQRIAQQMLAKNITLTLAAAPRQLVDLLERHTSSEVIQQIRVYPTLDEALEAGEKLLLEKQQSILARNSVDGLAAKEKLFQAAVDDLDAHLREQERFEEIMASLASYVEQKTLVQGDLLVEEGKKIENVVFVLLGSVSLLATDSTGKQSRLASVGPGGMIATQAAWDSWLATYTARAERRTLVAIMPRQVIRDLERATPQTAMDIYKYMAEKLAQSSRYA
jgi:SulP family sulfate permease